MAGDTEKTADSWVDEAKKEYRKLFSELDLLLRALDRFFFLENQPASRISFINKNLLPELNAVKDVTLRILHILETVMPASHRNAYWFQKYAESRLIDSRRRDIVRKGMYVQETPEQSLYLLYDSFISLKSLLADIMKGQDIQYMSFKNIGQIIGKEIRENTFFNPFRQDINPEYDYIANKEIKEVVKRIEDKEVRKTVSILFLHMFRFLRYINQMEHKSMRASTINTSLVIFTLLKSEIDQFITYIGKTSDVIADKELSMLVRALSYQFAMESKRVFQQELKDLVEKKNSTQLRARVENSRGILKNLTEQSIIQLARHWNPNIRGEKIFEVFINKSVQSFKLREDLYTLHRFLSEVEKYSDNREGMERPVKVLLNYMEYFENFTFLMLRYDDYEEFSFLFEGVRADYKKGDMEKFFESVHKFNIFVSTTFRQIQNRAELKNRPMDLEKVEDVVQQYLGTN